MQGLRCCIVLLPIIGLVAACQTRSPDQPSATTEPSTPGDAPGGSTTAAPLVSATPVLPETPSVVAEAPREGPPVRLVLALNNPTMRGSDPSVQVEARLDTKLFLQNTSEATVQLNGMIPASFELQWRIVGADGVVWKPTFLPPPPPRPGKPIPVSVPAGATVEYCHLHGISGFRKPGDDTWYRVLPPGVYEVSVSGVRFEGVKEPLGSEPVRLKVRRR